MMTDIVELIRTYNYDLVSKGLMSDGDAVYLFFGKRGYITVIFNPITKVCCVFHQIKVATLLRDLEAILQGRMTLTMT